MLKKLYNKIRSWWKVDRHLKYNEKKVMKGIDGARKEMQDPNKFGKFIEPILDDITDKGDMKSET